MATAFFAHQRPLSGVNGPVCAMNESATRATYTMPGEHNSYATCEVSPPLTPSLFLVAPNAPGKATANDSPDPKR